MEKPAQKLRARRHSSLYFSSLRWVIVAMAFIIVTSLLTLRSLTLFGDYNNLPENNPQNGIVKRSVSPDVSFNKNKNSHIRCTKAPIQKGSFSENVVKKENTAATAAKRILSASNSSDGRKSPGEETEVLVHNNTGTLYPAPFATSGHDGGPFITQIRKLSQCHYEVKNFCVINGKLSFFHNGNGAKFKKGLQACNEFSRHSQSIYIKYWSSPLPYDDSASLPAPLNTVKKGWILQFWCQDLFHMTLSLLPAFHTKKDVAQEDPDVYIRIARGRRHKGGYCNVKLGDPRNFENSRNAKYGTDKQFPFAGNPYWPFYRILTKYPEKIHPLVPDQSIQTACYRQGIIDKRYIKSMMGSEARHYSTTILNMMNVTPGQPTPCGKKYRVTLIDRRGRTRRLKNVPEILEVVRSVGMEAQAVAFETIPIREQLRLVTTTDVLLGVHGNGLMWQQFLPPGSVVIELVGVWYTPYSLLWGHSYFHSRMVNNPEYVRRGEFVPFAHNLTEVRELLLAAKEALDRRWCARTPYKLPNKPLSMLYVNCTPHC